MLNKRNGYYTLVLANSIGQKKTVTVHRLVAQAFCEKPNGCDCVNHKNEIKTDNRSENLEWCTKAYNNTYNGKNDRCCKSIAQINKDGELINIWKSVHEAGRNVPCANYKNISAVCRGLRKTAGGYYWRFTDV